MFKVVYLCNLVYVCLLIVISPWLVYQAITKNKYREGYQEKFWGKVPICAGNQRAAKQHTSNQKRAWFHAVSFGEVQLLEQVLKEFRLQFPDWECVISTTTKTGYELAKKKHPDLVVFYCPLDFSWAVSNALKRINPDLLVLAELELWPNLISLAKQNGAQVALINARLSDNSFQGYSRIRSVISKLFSQLDLIVAQSDTYAKRFVQLGADADKVVAAGSIKFDGIETDRNNPQTQALRKLANIQTTDQVFLAGSTCDPEERYALESFLQLKDHYPQLRLVLVPRHPERFQEVARLLEATGERWQLRSELPLKNDSRILLVDAMGELKAWWGTADIAFVGGSFGKRGGQNMIEPAAYGASVSFGPNTSNFRDVVGLLLNSAAAIVVHDQQEMATFVQQCLDQPLGALKRGKRAQELVQSGTGATGYTVTLLRQMVYGNQPEPATQSHSKAA